MESKEIFFEDLLTAIAEKKYGYLRSRLAELDAPDAAEFLDEYAPKDALAVVFRLLPKLNAAEAFAYLDADVQAQIINAITDREVGDLVNDLYTDDAADLLEELPANVVKRVITNINRETRELINQYLRYPESSAGSVMTSEFIDLKPTMTVEEAFTRIRTIGEDKETLYTLFVVDKNLRLEGVVNAKDLMLSERGSLISDIVNTNFVSVKTTDDRESAAELISRYDLLAIPVTDTEDRLVGIITVDDVIDVIQEETTEDFEIMAAITPSERPYLKTGVFALAKNRILWLMLLMVSATFTGTILLRFEDAFTVVPLLVTLMPMLMDTGGNAGSQTSTLTIRGMAVGEIEPSDILRVLWKELRVAVIVGTTLSAVNFGRVMLMYPGNIRVAAVASIALVSTVIMAKSIGCVLPMAAKVCKLDPAIMASPLITTLVDAGALIVYFSVAKSILRI
ncbi:MAG: magnesium transporter [Oscillospiraceae bacterium]|jgi:magnesium transporter|nr:magnesium transporter [Oscillospiraceae bacterium]